MGDVAQAKEIFLQHDPRAGDIWPNDMKQLRTERVERMEEARKLGEDIERIKAAKDKVQTALEALKVKLREAEAQAAIDPAGPAQRTVETLRELLTKEEPKLVQLLNEKQQQYELDYGRLAELKRELAHLKHNEDQLSSAIQAEFQHWLQAVEERYPGAGKAVSSTSPAPSATPPPLPRPQSSSGAAANAGSSAVSSATAASPSASASRAVAQSTPLSVVSASNTPTPTHDAAPRSTSEECAKSSAQGTPPVAPETSGALAKAEAALRSLRDRLEDAKKSGDTHRQQMLEQLLSVEEPRLARLRADGAG